MGELFWYNYLYFVGASIGFIASSIVFIILLKMKYKDYSTSLRIYLHIIDMASEIILLIPYIPHEQDSIYVCYYNAFYYFIIIFRSFWVWFIAYSLYMIVCKNNKSVQRKFFLFFSIFLIISFLASVPVLVMKINDVNCSIYKNKDYRLIYIYISGIAFEVIIFFCIFYFYYKIRKTIKDEIEKSDIHNKVKRIYLSRLWAHPFIFLILILFNSLDAAQTASNPENRDLFTIRITIVILYPLMNSILYGYTRSLRKYLSSLFINLPDYKNKQKILNDLRSDGILKDRAIFDLTDISEDEILKYSLISST